MTASDRSTGHPHRPLRSAIAGAAALFVPLDAAIAETKVACPATLSAPSDTFSPAAEPMDAATQNAPFSHLSVSDGPVADLAILRPDKPNAYNVENPTTAAIYITCHYDGTDAIRALALPRDLAWCTIAAPHSLACTTD